MTNATQAAVDPKLFRQALGQFPTGVCVVTAAAEGGNLGMTISSFNSLSLDPPLVLFSVDGRAASMPLWERARSCTINVLTENQKDISDRFARSSFKQVGGNELIRRGFRGPVLAGRGRRLPLRRWAKHDGGDHVLFIAGELSRIDRKPAGLLQRAIRIASSD